jgi:CBS domain containing-hemolysin-like protein
MVEEIVGPMSEPGEDDEEYLAIDQDTYQVDGSLDIDEADGELARVSLMVPTRPLADLYRPPRHDSKVGDQLMHNNFALEVTEMQGGKIEKILVTRLVRPEEVVT